MSRVVGVRGFSRWEYRLLTFAVVTLGFASGDPARADEPMDWPVALNQATSPFSGAVTGLAVEHGRAVLSTEGTLAVFDVSDPELPIFLGFDTTSGTTQDLVVSNEFAYLAGYHAGLHVHDVSQPASFSLPVVGMFPLQGSDSFSGVGIDGTRVFASGYGAGLTVLDCSDPTDPQVIGSAPGDVGEAEHFYARDIKRVGDRIYMAGGDDDWGAVKIHRDVSGGDPVLLGEFRVIELPSPPTGVSIRIEVAGDVAYVADSGLGLYVLDISEPTQPVLIRTEPVTPRDMRRAGNLLVLLSSGQMIVYDISDPRSPIQCGSIDLPTTYGRLTIDGNTAFVADARNLVTLDLTDPKHPRQLGHLDITGFRARDLEAVGDLVYVADAGIRVVDVSDPSAPVPAGSGGNAVHYSLVVDGNKAAAQWENFGIIHLYELGEDGRSPVKVGEVRESGIQGYDLEGSTLYVGTVHGGLQIHAVGNPANPVRRGEWREEGKPARQVMVMNDLAFVGSSDPDLVILDVESSSVPRKIGSYQAYAGGWVNAFTIVGSRAYIAESLAFSIVDISDPTDPRRMSVVETEGNQFVDVSVTGDLAFVMQEGPYEGRLHVIQIKDPSAPFIISRDVGVDRIARYEAGDDLLYLARGYLGLQILDLTVRRPRLFIQRAADPENPIRLRSLAPAGLPFEVEGSHDLRSWFPLGWFTGDTLQQAVELCRDSEPSMPDFFRVSD